MTTLSVSKLNAVQAYNNADAAGKKLLSDLFPDTLSGSVMDRVKTFEDVCAEAGEDPGDYSIPANASDDEQAVNAYRKLRLIFKVVNEGWTPDYANSNQRKYYPWLAFIAGSGFSYGDYDHARAAAAVGARLSTDTSEKAKYIGETFRDIYNVFLSK